MSDLFLCSFDKQNVNQSGCSTAERCMTVDQSDSSIAVKRFMTVNQSDSCLVEPVGAAVRFQMTFSFVLINFSSQFGATKIELIHAHRVLQVLRRSCFAALTLTTPKSSGCLLILFLYKAKQL